MNTKEVYLTLEGKLDLEKELKYLKKEKRKEVSARIKEAISLGDLSENSEYNEAKNEQAAVEKRISEIEEILNHMVLIESSGNVDIVSLGSTVVLKDLEYDEIIEYTVVGSAEADPRKGRLSNESPVGKQILGKTKEEVVEVQVPAGVIKYEIVEIK
ncbi:MAG: transcription elongation factor GreA [Clostridia bacterium]